MIRKHFFALMLLPVLACFAAQATSQQVVQDLREQINRGTVGLISGGVNGTYIRISSDLGAVLDSDDLRVLSILGKGSVQNIADLLYLRGIDIAIVQSDVLTYLDQQHRYANIKERIHYVTKLYNEEFHLLVRDDINTVADLAGKKVNFDGKGSGTAMTASIIFETLGVSVNPTYLDQSAALEALRKGDISGLVYVAGQPAQLFKTVAADEDLKFLEIDFTPSLMQTYLPSKLTSESYPTLVSEGAPVNTVAVGAVMAAYNWDPGHSRQLKVAHFVDTFFSRFDEFLLAGRHPKWREVNLSAVVPGWQRLGAATEWFDNQAGSN